MTELFESITLHRSLQVSSGLLGPGIKREDGAPNMGKSVAAPATVGEDMGHCSHCATAWEGDPFAAIRSLFASPETGPQFFSWRLFAAGGTM